VKRTKSDDTLSVSMNSIFCLCLLVLASCSAYHNPKKAIAHFKANKALFQRYAENWWKNHSTDDLTLMPWQRVIYWNDFAIKPHGSGYDVRNGRALIVSGASWERAAAAAGVDPVELQQWVARTKSLDLMGACPVGTKLPIKEQYLELWLPGSLPDSWGYIYVPPGHTAPLENFKEEATSIGRPFGFRKLVYLGGNWFFFEED